MDYTTVYDGSQMLTGSCDDTSAGFLIGVLTSMGIGIWIFSMLLCILMIVAEWIILEKAGEKGWKILIPFYGGYTFYKVMWQSGWMYFLTLLPIVNVVISILTMLKLAKAFGKSVGFGVGLIFLPVIFVPILAFGQCSYEGVPESIA